jgi:6-phospho-beta-glucosidase
MNRVLILGGGGVRTPLVMDGLARAGQALGVRQLVLFDIDRERAEIMARIGREIARRLDSDLEIQASSELERAAEGASLVLNSVRVGGMAARARDERIAIAAGFAGQETTGPVGAAMALRGIPVSLAQARVVERQAPGAWFLNFSNPAGVITQALANATQLRVIGICDTPSELFFRIAQERRLPLADFAFDYAGLNHLGWISGVKERGRPVLPEILEDDALLRRLYPAELFDPEMIRSLGLIPTEYLFFYYHQRRAHENQLRAGASRGEELLRLNESLFRALAHQDPAGALETYRAYLIRRNSSYLRLEAHAESAFAAEAPLYDPFETATGYHRIALEVMTALSGNRPREIVLNVSNHGAVDGLAPDDVVEVPCEVSASGVRPRRVGQLSARVRGLVQSVKEYERLLIRAVHEQSRALARLALMENPIVGQWDLAGRVLNELLDADRQHLSGLR